MTRKKKKRVIKPLKKGQYRSNLEKHFQKQLAKRKVVHAYEAIRLPYTLRKYYLPDFAVDKTDGVFFIEVKGYLRPSDRTKLLAVIRENPSIDLRLAFAVNNKLNRHTETRYGDWCDKHGIPWCVGELPREWF